MKRPFRTLLFSAWALMFAVACSHSQKDSKRAGNQSFGDSSLHLAAFSSVPDTLEGCSGTYTFDTLDLKKGDKIFLTKLSEFAIIRIGKKDIYLKYDSLDSREINEKTQKEVFKGYGYTAILITRVDKVVDETFESSGTLEIIGNKRRIKIKVHGIAGC